MCIEILMIVDSTDLNWPNNSTQLHNTFMVPGAYVTTRLAAAKLGRTVLR